MSQYYLMSQLPSLDGIGETAQLPITEERLCALCSQFLDKKSLKVFNSLTLTPAREQETTSSSLVDLWNQHERQLRLALAGVRANKMKKSFDTGAEAFPVQILQTAQTAADMEDPLAAEQYLNRFRLDFLEMLRPMDPFSENSVFYYGLKLKLISRIRQFDKAKGQNAYQNIYTSILRGGEQEATQCPKI